MGTDAERVDIAFDIFNPRCPTRQVLDLIGDRWTVLVVLSLRERTLRFSEIRSRLDGISPKVLTSALRRLERDGLVTREVFAEVPPRVEYTLTPLGTTLDAPLSALRDWAETHMPDIARARAES